MTFNIQHDPRHFILLLGYFYQISSILPDIRLIDDSCLQIEGVFFLWCPWFLECIFIPFSAVVLFFAQNKLRLCLANHKAGYFSNLACDWLSIVGGHSEQETGNAPWCDLVRFLLGIRFQQKRITQCNTLHPPIAIVSFNDHTNDTKYDLTGKIQLTTEVLLNAVNTRTMSYQKSVE